jgi:hypothetical protein
MRTTLKGTVTVSGRPAHAATVELHNAAGDVIDQIAVDDEGGFTYHLVEGRWLLAVYDPFGHRGTASVEMQTGDDRVTTNDLGPDESGLKRGLPTKMTKWVYDF